jgi:hypothetical protein
MGGIGTIDFGEISSMAYHRFTIQITSPVQIENWTGDLAGGGGDQLRFTTLDQSRLDAFPFTGYRQVARLSPSAPISRLFLVPDDSSTVLDYIGLIIRKRQIGTIEVAVVSDRHNQPGRQHAGERPIVARL